MVFVAALSRLGYLSESEAVMSLEIRRVGLEALIASNEATLRSLRERVGLPRLFRLETEYMIGQLASESSWVATTIEEIKSGGLAVDQHWYGQVGGAIEDLSGTAPDNVPLAVRQWAPGGLISEGLKQPADDDHPADNSNS
jgi:hypothetical protein